jgi:hypothetical protein
MAEKWWQKDKKEIHISAPIFLPRLLQVVPIANLITKSPQFVLRIEGVTHDSVVNLSELFLVCRAHPYRGCDRHKAMAERWGQKNQQEIYFSALIFLPLQLFLL